MTLKLRKSSIWLFSGYHVEAVRCPVLREDDGVSEESERFPFDEAGKFLGALIVQVEGFSVRDEVRSVEGFDADFRQPDFSDDRRVFVGTFVYENERRVLSGISQDDGFVSEFVHRGDARERGNVELLFGVRYGDQFASEKAVLGFGEP